MLCIAIIIVQIYVCGSALFWWRSRRNYLCAYSTKLADTSNNRVVGLLDYSYYHLSVFASKLGYMYNHKLGLMH